MSIPAVRLAAGAGALCLLSIQIHGAIEYSEGGSGYALSSQIAALCALAVIPVMSVIAYAQDRPGVAAGLMTTTLFFLAYTLPTTLDRSAALRETVAQQADDVKLLRMQRKMARKAVTDAMSAMEMECATGEGPKCRGWRLAVQQRKDYLARLEALPVPTIERGHGMGVLAWVTGLPESALRKISALGNALGLDLGIAVLAAFAAHGGRKRGDKADWPDEAPEPPRQSKPDQEPRGPSSASLGESWIEQYVRDNPQADPKVAYADYQEALRGRGGKRMRLSSFKAKFEKIREAA